MKARVVTEAIRIVTGEGDGEYDGAFQQLLPDPELDEYYLWNRAQTLFDLVMSTSSAKKDTDNKERISLF